MARKRYEGKNAKEILRCLKGAIGREVADMLAVGLDGALDLGAVALSEASGTPLDHVQLVSPLPPTSIRDFAVLEQHVSGIVRGTRGDVREAVPDAFREEPVLNVTNPDSSESSFQGRRVEPAQRPPLRSYPGWSRGGDRRIPRATPSTTLVPSIAISLWIRVRSEGES